MIQRIQTIWLLLAATASLLSLKFSFYLGDKVNNINSEPLNGTSNFIITIVSVAVALATLFAIFLYKDRPLQKKVTLLSFLLQCLVLVLYFLELKQYIKGVFAITALLTFGIPVFLILAWLGIRKDEKLIKSMDRLR
jgi:uncharacterized membrane protein YozB (DUF420 family)